MAHDDNRLFIGRLRQIDCSGNKLPLRGMLVDVFHATLAASGSPEFTKLTQSAARTDEDGWFHFFFTDPVAADASEPPAFARRDGAAEMLHATGFDEQELAPDDQQPSMPEDEVEEFFKRYPDLRERVPTVEPVVQPADRSTDTSDQRSLPRPIRFACKVTALMETVDPTRSSTDAGALTLMEVMDDRFEQGRDWGRSPQTRYVSLPKGGRVYFRRVWVPANNTTAAMLSGDTAARVAKPPMKSRGNAFAFLGVGRATWDEIGGFADNRPEFVGKTGYFRSANTWKANPGNVVSLLPSRYDAPFAGWLSLQGVFGGDLAEKPLYYSVTLSSYTGDTSTPFAPENLTDPRSPSRSTYTHFYEYLSPTSPDGKWKCEQLGPFIGTLDGKRIAVYRRRLPRPTNVEYWPDRGLLAGVYTDHLPDGLRVATVRAFEQIGGTATEPILREIPLDQDTRAAMPLVLDSNPVAPRFDKLYPDDPSSYVKLRLVSCTWDTGVENYVTVADVTECNEVAVTPGQAGGNEGILLRFTISDSKGGPHKHWLKYTLTAEYTPRSTADSPDKKTLKLRRTFAGTGPLDERHDLLQPLPNDPATPVSNRDCVLVPVADDGWPPEKGDPHPTPCTHYGVGLQLEAWARQIDGSWERFYSPVRTARYIVLRNAQARCT